MYVTERIKWEPLYEATQIKGDGETHPLLSPNDEFADYETWDQGNLDLSTLKTDEMLYGEYAREGLKRGLLLEDKLGVNPYKSSSGEQWLMFWGVFRGEIAENQNVVRVPIHITARFENGKIVEESGYWDNQIISNAFDN